MAIASVITNGDFSDASPLAGFVTTGSDVGEPTGEFAQLETNGVFIRTLEQAFVAPVGASVLSFDFAFSTQTTSGNPSRLDSFAVSYVTAVDGESLDIFVVDAFGSLADPSEGVAGFVPIDVSLDTGVSIPGFTPLTGGINYSGRVSLALPTEVLGEDATIFFSLLDESDNASSRAAVDNIGIEERMAAIPEPISVVIWLLTGSIGFVITRFCSHATKCQ